MHDFLGAFDRVLRLSTVRRVCRSEGASAGYSASLTASRCELVFWGRDCLAFFWMGEDDRLDERLDDRFEDVSDCPDSDLESPEDRDISFDRDEPVEVLRDGQWKSDRSTSDEGAGASSAGSFLEVWISSLWREEFEDDHDRDGDDVRTFDISESAKAGVNTGESALAPSGGGALAPSGEGALAPSGEGALAASGEGNLAASGPEGCDLQLAKKARCSFVSSSSSGSLMGDEFNKAGAHLPSKSGKVCAEDIGRDAGCVNAIKSLEKRSSIRFPNGVPIGGGLDIFMCIGGGIRGLGRKGIPATSSPGCWNKLPGGAISGGGLVIS